MAHFKIWRWKLVTATVIAVFVVLAIMWTQRGLVSGWLVEQQFREAVATPQPYRGAVSDQPVPSHAAQEINLAVPFAPQAPTGNWDQPYQDACEEATLIMVERYLRGASLTLAEMDTEILTMVDFQEQQFGFFKDSNVAETVRLAGAYFPHLSAEATYDITAQDIQGELALGNPVIVLVDGRKLGNPFYTAPGPDRHTLVIKGMSGQKFITNDPGTKRGADFVYPVDVVMRALVDYDGDTAGTGVPAMIVMTPAD